MGAEVNLRGAMEELAATLGVSLPVLRFLLAFFLTIPCSWLWRFLPGARLRHLYSALSGCLLSHFSFGWDANLHFLVPMLIGYGSMLLFRRRCGSITFVGAFGFLICCHVYYMSGDAWKQGGMDCTGALMVLTLKVVSSAINYQDGLLKEEDLRPAQKKNRILLLPSLDEYVGFNLCCGTHLAGPVYEIQDYLDWTKDQGIWSSSQKPPSPYGGALKAFLQALVCMVIHMSLSPRVPVSWIFEPQYGEWGFWHRWGYTWLCGFAARWKYYFIWSISEASVIISGLGFTGWSDSHPSKPKWNRAINVDILGVELAESSAVLPLVWNIHVSTWLRLYVYERLTRKGQKAGLFELLVTQIVSAVWHGLYAGYILFFINSALMIAGSRVIYRWQQAVPESSWVLNKISWLVSLFYTVFVLNYACIGFIVNLFPAVFQCVYLGDRETICIVVWHTVICFGSFSNFAVIQQFILFWLAAFFGFDNFRYRSETTKISKIEGKENLIFIPNSIVTFGNSQAGWLQFSLFVATIELACCILIDRRTFLQPDFRKL